MSSQATPLPALLLELARLLADADPTWSEYLMDLAGRLAYAPPESPIHRDARYELQTIARTIGDIRDRAPDLPAAEQQRFAALLQALLDATPGT